MVGDCVDVVVGSVCIIGTKIIRNFGEGVAFLTRCILDLDLGILTRLSPHLYM